MVWLTGGVLRPSASWRSGNNSSRCPVAVSGERHPATVQPAPSPPHKWSCRGSPIWHWKGRGLWSLLVRCMREQVWVWCWPVVLWMGLVMGQHRLSSGRLFDEESCRRRAAVPAHNRLCSMQKKERSCRTSHLQMGSHPYFCLIFCSDINADSSFAEILSHITL